MFSYMLDNIEALVLTLSVILSFIGITNSIKSARDNAKDRATMTYLIERSKDRRFDNSVKVIFDLNQKIN